VINISVTAKNVLVGIGDFKIDGTSVGSTRGGVTITKTNEVFEKIIDQNLSPVGLSKVRESYTVKTEIAEATLANLKVVWDVSDAVGAAGPTQTLSLGTTSTVAYKALEFYGVSPEGLDRKFYCYKAFISEVGDTVLAKDNIAVLPVTFMLFPDTDMPTGKQIGYIEDELEE